MKYNLIDLINVKSDNRVNNRVHLLYQKRRAVALKSYAPSFDEGYQGNLRSFDPDRERREKKKFMHQFKKVIWLLLLSLYFVLIDIYLLLIVCIHIYIYIGSICKTFKKY